MAGRPSKFRKEYCEGLIEHMKDGMPFETYAAEINVDRDTLYAWEKKHREFSDAKKRAKPKQYNAMYKIGMAGATGQVRAVVSRTTTIDKDGTTTVKETLSNGFNAAAWIFMMKNCFGWKDLPDFSENDWIDSITFNGKKEAA